MANINIVKGEIGNALTSVAPNHIIGVAQDIFDEELQMYQSEINSGLGDGAFDVSVKYPTSGVDGGNTYTLEGALDVLNANLAGRKKKGGMSIKFIKQDVTVSYNVVNGTSQGASLDAITVNNQFTLANGSAYSANDILTAIEDTTDKAAVETAINGLSNNGDSTVIQYYLDGTNYATWTITKNVNTKNKYVQYRLMSPTWSTNTANWQGVDKVITSGSKNLAESGAVAEITDNISFENTYNLIDFYPVLKDAGGISYNNNKEWNGKIVSFVLSPALELDIPIDSYCLSVKAKCDGNITTSGNGLQFVVKYTDDSTTPLTIPNNTNDWREFSVLLDSTKKISDIHFTYGEGSDNIVHIKNIQLAKGVVPIPYVPTKSVADYNVRNDIHGVYTKHSVTFSGIQNKSIQLGVRGGLFVLHASSQSDFVLNCYVRVNGVAIALANLSQDNNYVAVNIPATTDDTYLYFYHGTTDNVDINFGVSRITGEDSLNHELFFVLDNIAKNAKRFNTDEEQINILKSYINKPFIANYKTLSASYKWIVDTIVDLHLEVERGYENKEYYIRAFGVHQGTFYFYIFSRDGEIGTTVAQFPISQTFQDTNVVFNISHQHLRGYTILDVTKISSDMGYTNNASNQIILSQYGIFDNYCQVTPNILELDEIEDGVYINANGTRGTLAEYLTTGFIKVEKNTQYKVYPQKWSFVNFYDSNKQRLRGSINSAPSSYSFSTQQNDKYVRISFNGLNSSQKELLMMQKVRLDDGTLLDPADVAVREKDDYSDGNYSFAQIKGKYSGVFTIGRYEQTSNLISLSVSSEEKLIATSLVGLYAGTIKKLKFKCQCDSAFTMTFGIGNIDQRNWGLISRTFTANVSNGDNELDVSAQIDKGERLFIIANSASSAANANIYKGDTGIHYESQESEIVMSLANGYIAISYIVDGLKYTSDSGFVSKSDFENFMSDINATIDGITLDKLFIASPNETLYKLSVTNEGTIQTVAVPTLGKILIMGNSYDISSYSPPVWWGDFGMAASRKENDWKHTLIRQLRNDNNVVCNFRKSALMNWETRWTTFDYSTLDDALSETYILVIIRIGENNTDTDYTRVQSRMETLLQYVITKLGTSVPIIVGGALRIRTAQNPYLQAACGGFDNVTYVDMTPAGQVTPFAAGLNQRVFGDDGVWHTISESTMADAVAGHPGDAVMAKMAELLYPVVVNKLGI